ncbi:phospholipase D-like protein [Motilibacter peucedani]|uniref:Phospholipase D-like protein n=1 Tax=Motilibacter peucedani TaxID=598650 RepID=A0A420XKV9_9ACTN|nr:PLD nuclease N-terminal domain-containing protein [Motilibacter peucedani]RKS69170.1 phospholipase D-like protein [Motilibacter peucedani]
MLRILPYLLFVALDVWALVDILQTREEDLEGLPKVVWVLFILLFPVIGALVYIFAGKKRRRPASPGGFGPYGGYRPSTPSVAPDDDPEFLERLRLSKWQRDLEERERKLREEGPDATG